MTNTSQPSALALSQLGRDLYCRAHTANLSPFGSRGHGQQHNHLVLFVMDFHIFHRVLSAVATLHQGLQELCRISSSTSTCYSKQESSQGLRHNESSVVFVCAHGSGSNNSYPKSYLFKGSQSIKTFLRRMVLA